MLGVHKIIDNHACGPKTHILHLTQSDQQLNLKQDLSRTMIHAQAPTKALA